MTEESHYTAGTKRIFVCGKIRLFAFLGFAPLLASCVGAPVQITEIRSASATGAYIVPYGVISGMTEEEARSHILTSFARDRFPTQKPLRVGRVYRVVPICGGVADWSRAYDETVARSETISVSC